MKTGLETVQNKNIGLKIKNAVSSSFIVGLLLHIVEALFGKLEKSLTAFIFTGYKALNNSFKKSFIYGVIRWFGVKNGNFKRIKNIAADKCEKSVIKRGITNIVDRIIFCPVRTISIGVFSFAIYSIIIYFLQVYIFEREVNSINLYFSICAAISSVILAMLKKSIYSLLRKSVIMNFLLFKFIGFNEKDEDSAENIKKIKSITAYAVGMFLGLCSFIIPPLYIIAAAIGLILFYVMLCRPETGMLIVFFGLPFLPTMILAFIIVLTAGCFFLKLIRGKRVISFEIIDVFILIFCFITLFSGVVSVVSSYSIRPALLYACFAFAYFIIVNMLRSPEMIIKCVKCVLFSSMLTGAFGIVQNYTGMSISIWQDTSMFSDISGRVVSTFENPNVLAEYLILCVPFIFILFAQKRSGGKLAPFGLLVINIACLVFTWSRGAWIGFIISSIILFVIINKKFIAGYLGALIFVPLLPFILPENIIARFASIGNISDSSTSYRVSIWQAVLKMLKDHFFGGIGTGLEPFNTVYPEYSLAGIETAPHSHNLFLQICVESGIAGVVVFLIIMFLFAQCSFSFLAGTHDRRMKLTAGAALCGVLAVLVQGMTDYIWYNYRIYLMFWLVISLGVAVSRYLSSNSEAKEIYLGHGTL